MSWTDFAWAFAVVGAWKLLMFLLSLRPPTKNPALIEWGYGPLNPEIVCPHCQVKGRVHLKNQSVKGGISDAKAAAAVMTGGASVLLTGLAKKVNLTQAYCENCQVVWPLVG